MSNLKTPIISILIGEGGSGGALALGVSDALWMMENSYYSVISPEGCASILWKDPSKIEEAAESLKITPTELQELGLCDKVFLEDRAFREIAQEISSELSQKIKELEELSTEELVEQRYQRFREIGRYTEVPLTSK